MNWYLKVLKQYADFSGRARRTEYWMFALFNILVVFALFIIATIIGAIAGGSSGAGAGAVIGYILYIIYGLATIIPSLAVVVRRLHDIGKGGGWIFISFVPLIGGIWLLILMFLDSEAGENRFGANPKD
ncbi:MAG: DUF805 domain-containing protein [Prevotellaceae bacterium]|nr:DUF805 domain-containing protein [Prevotellaceae bacterium]